MKALFAWTARHVVLFVVLVLAIAAFQFGVLNSLAEWVRAAGMTTTAEVSEQLVAKRENAELEFDREVSSFRQATLGERKAALKARETRLDELEKALAEEPGFLDRYNPNAVLQRRTLELEKRVIEGEIAVLLGHMASTSLRDNLVKIRVPTVASIGAAVGRCRAANREVRKFNGRSYPEKWARNLLKEEARQLTVAAKRACGEARKLTNRRELGLRNARKLGERVREADDALVSLEHQGRQAISRYEPESIKATFGDILGKAAIALAAIMLMPFVIRAIFYYVLAPLAERRAEIRITVPDGGGVPIAASHPSRVSIPIVLGKGEELLVRQGHHQGSSIASSKSTRWLLDYRHMLSSIAAGLHFLTRFRGEGEMTTISAVQDPLAELTEMTLPQGSACVLHPRSIVAVVQPVNQPVRIRSHWRLFSLNAWLTMQLRYLSFHGPGRIILKGGRGIRVERAEQGRIFGQDQLVGFSADLAYSVERTETFAPYFFGKESLFKDKVRDGSGVVVIEEAPLAARGGKGVRSGLEGTLDAIMKAFGL